MAVSNIRSIPACTGEPSFLNGVHTGLSPRVRGNRLQDCGGRYSTLAVYPRVYGGTTSRQSWQTLSNGPGSIPACTGEPRNVFSRPCLLNTGLSPRVRGNRAIMLKDPSSRHGSIPACTGEPNGHDRRMQMRTHGVYPRVYGGTLAVGPGMGDAEALQRSIPACTGEPSRAYFLALRQAAPHG